MDEATVSREPAPDRAARHGHWARPDPVGDILAAAWSSTAAAPREIRVRPEVYRCILAELDPVERALVAERGRLGSDRKSTRLNSSHANISYAVFCLKKKNNSTYHLYHV